MPVFATSIALLVVFLVLLLIGLFLDLVSDVFTFVAISSIAGRIHYNRSWFSKFRKLHLRYEDDAIERIKEFELDGKFFAASWRMRRVDRNALDMSSPIRNSRHRQRLRRGAIHEIRTAYQSLREVETKLLIYAFSKNGNSIPGELDNRRRQRRFAFSISVAFFLAGLLALEYRFSNQPMHLLLMSVSAFAVVLFPMVTSNRYYTLLFALVHQFFLEDSGKG